MANGRFVNNVGSSTRPLGASGAHIFNRHYYRHFGASGDVRGEYKDLEFTSTGSGETVRLRGIAKSALVATGGTVNALHATGRVSTYTNSAGATANATVSGALNAIRATLEVAGTTPTPGGTLAALQLDSNISTGWTAGANDAFIRVSQTGAGLLKHLFNIEEARGSAGATSLVTADHANDLAADYFIRCRINGTTVWLMATSTAPAAS